MHKTHHFDIRNTKIIWGGAPDRTPFGAPPPVPLSDGLDTRPCKILNPRPLALPSQHANNGPNTATDLQ